MGAAKDEGPTSCFLGAAHERGDAGGFERGWEQGRREQRNAGSPQPPPLRPLLGINGSRCRLKAEHRHDANARLPARRTCVDGLAQRVQPLLVHVVPHLQLHLPADVHRIQRHPGAGHAGEGHVKLQAARRLGWRAVTQGGQLVGGRPLQHWRSNRRSQATAPNRPPAPTARQHPAAPAAASQHPR